MEYNNLIVELADDIITLTISREKALNALNKETMQELNHFFTVEALQNKSLKGIIITGAGPKSFVAGADIKEFLGLDADAGKEMAKYGQDVFFAIEQFHRPVIAAVNGFALGGGCELAMACHMRIAGEKARFSQPEVNLGLIPGYGGTQRLVQLIGKGKAMELLMTADMVGAEEALRLGLVNHVVPQGDEVTKAKEILLKISEKAPLAISKIISCVDAFYRICEDGFAKEVAEFGACCKTEDFKEGAAAFVERRKADFKGR